METLVDSPLKGSELMKECLRIEPDLNKALDLMIQITIERKFRETCKMKFRSLYEFDKYIKSLGLKDPEAFRERVRPSLILLPQPPSEIPQDSRFRRWRQRLLCCSSVCRSTPPIEQK